MGELRLTTTLQERGPAAAVVLDDEQVAQVGEGRRAFGVRVTVNGHAFAGRVVRMGGEFLLGLNQEVRAAARAEAGDEVEVVIALDTAPREVEVPPALQQALDADADAKRIYDGLAFTHRKEFTRWVAEAKKDETRDRRVVQTLEMLRAGRTRS
jgi:uncharacterized protein YdeI (YjbR/CyaY-like superfamily)